MISDRSSTGRASLPSVIEGVFSASTVERTSFHRCGRNCVLGMFPLVLGAEESSRGAPVLAEDVLLLLEDTVEWWPLAEGKMGCGEMEVEGVSGGCM